jgi:hypothetical protein
MELWALMFWKSLFHEPINFTLRIAVVSNLNTLFNISSLQKRKYQQDDPQITQHGGLGGIFGQNPKNLTVVHRIRHGQLLYTIDVAFKPKYSDLSREDLGTLTC